jgi:hypothetical protein
VRKIIKIIKLISEIGLLIGAVIFSVQAILAASPAYASAIIALLWLIYAKEFEHDDNI